MATKKQNSRQVDRWTALNEALRASVPQVSAVLADEEDFVGVRFVLRSDRTVLGVLKRYGPDGGVLVCFGSGYGVAGAFVSLEGSVAAGHWKVDKPWEPSGK